VNAWNELARSRFISEIMRRQAMTNGKLITVSSAVLIVAGASFAVAQGTTAGGVTAGTASSAAPSTATGSATASEKMSGTDTSTSGSQKSSGNIGAPNAAGGSPTGGGGK
jgi:hypothetical protein